MSLRNTIQFSIRVVAIATAFLGLATPASAQRDSTVRVDSAATLETITVKANAPKSRAARERQLIAGNRILAKQLASYDKRIAQLEARLDSLRIESAHKWREAREMENAAAEARERRVALERRLAILERDSSRVVVAGPR